MSETTKNETQGHPLAAHNPIESRAYADRVLADAAQDVAAIAGSFDATAVAEFVRTLRKPSMDFALTDAWNSLPPVARAALRFGDRAPTGVELAAAIIAETGRRTPAPIGWTP